LIHLVDSSVWASLAEPRERFHEAAKQLVLNSGSALAALDLTLYEVANVVGMKMSQPQRAESLFNLLLVRCGERLLRVNHPLASEASQLSLDHGLSAYDAAYVAAARRNGWQLVSLDLRDLVSKGLAVTPDAALYP
jgi:predicted nucleic acid-binding protein